LLVAAKALPAYAKAEGFMADNTILHYVVATAISRATHPQDTYNVSLQVYRAPSLRLSVNDHPLYAMTFLVTDSLVSLKDANDRKALVEVAARNLGTDCKICGGAWATKKCYEF
jgi:hypothetical protein